jgi:hypothetical protein
MFFVGYQNKTWFYVMDSSSSSNSGTRGAIHVKIPYLPFK